MTDTFTASNGITVEVVPDEYLIAKGYADATYATAGPLGIDALREYFQHERDEQLGRWRDPENPDLVVYPNGDTAVVLCEASGACWDVARPRHLTGLEDSSWLATAARYFAAHPEPEPEWHDAQPGEVWLLTIDGKEHPAQTIVGRIAIYPHDADPEFFIPTLIPTNTIGDIWEHTWSPTDHRITGGRRLYPEESDDDR